MSDVSGSRFLQRFAGGDGFQRELKRSSQPMDRQSANAPGDFTQDSGSGASGSFDYSMTEQAPDHSSPSTLRGPGSFGKQVRREKYIEDNNIAQGGGTINGGEFVNKYSQANRQAQTGQSDGSSIANKYINAAAQTNPIDIAALDKHIRRTPLYSEAKSELAGLQVYGDKYKNARENLPNWSQPNAMEATESPDFEGMYDRTKKDLDSIEI